MSFLNVYPRIKDTAAYLTARGDGHIISANDNKDEDSPIAGQNRNSGGIVLYCQSHAKSGSVRKGLA